MGTKNARAFEAAYEQMKQIAEEALILASEGCQNSAALQLMEKDIEQIETELERDLGAR